MQRDANEPQTDDQPPESTARRSFLGTAIAGAAGIGISSALVACGNAGEGQAAGTANAEPSPAGGGQARARYEVPPGQLDDYYIMASGGHSGEMRIYGLPSGRTIKRIPVFNVDPMVGWGITNESKKILGTKPDGSLRYHTGDTHHVHGSYTDGTYDGRYFWVNDKLNSRVARVRGDYHGVRPHHRGAERAGLPRHLPRQARPGRPGGQPHHARVLRRGVPHPVLERAATWTTRRSTRASSPASTPRAWRCAGR